MDWKQILQKRRQTFHWKDEIPPRELIDQILEEVHSFCPSKQLIVPWNLHVYDWSNKDLRLEMFQKSWCSSDKPDDIRNPQILAPYLFVFSKRTPQIEDYLPDEKTVNKAKEEEWGVYDQIQFFADHNNARSQTNIEIGMAAMFTAYSAVDKGLDVGFCCNFHEYEPRGGGQFAWSSHDDINEFIKSKDNQNVLLSLGIGYGNLKREKRFYNNPFTDKPISRTSYIDWIKEHKPESNVYIHKNISDNADEPDTGLEDFKQSIIQECICYMNDVLEYKTEKPEKCIRDLMIALDSYLIDINDNTNGNIVHLGNSFWIQDKCQIKHPDVTLQLHEFLIKQVKIKLEEQEVYVNEHIEYLFSTFKNILTNGPNKKPYNHILNVFSRNRSEDYINGMSKRVLAPIEQYV